MDLSYGSVCSGIEAASEAWAPLGWRPRFFSEIEAFPSAVLAARHPGVPNLGDMTKFKEWPDADLDVLVGGTPCQSFSVAGLREGLGDARGNLMLTFAAIARRYRPAWVVWENVPGVLSSGGGSDFGSLLGILTGRAVQCPAGGWQNSGVVPGIPRAYGVAWRVLDAQHFGVPQRRRRVFVVGRLGDWRGAAAVLLERASMRGDPPPRRAPRQGAPAGAQAGAGAGGREGVPGGPGGGGAGDGRPGPDGVVGTLEARHAGGFQSAQSAARGHLIASAVAPTLAGSGNRTGGDRPPGTNVETAESLVVETAPVAFECKRGGDADVVSPPLRSMNNVDSNDSGGGHVAVAIQGTLIGRTEGGPNGVGATQDGSMFTLTKQDRHAVAFPISADALRGAGESKTPSADAEGRVRLRDPGLGIGADGDPAGTIAAAGPGAVAVSVNFEDGLAPHGNVTLRDVAEPLKADIGNHTAVLVLDPLRIACGCGEVFYGELDTPCPACRRFRSSQVTYPPSRGGAEVRAMPPIGEGARMVPGQAFAFKASHYTRGKDGAPSDVAPPLSADADRGDQDPLVFETRFARNGRGAPESVCPPLKATSGETGRGDAAPIIAYGITDDETAVEGQLGTMGRPSETGGGHPPAVAYGPVPKQEPFYEVSGACHTMMENYGAFTGDNNETRLVRVEDARGLDWQGGGKQTDLGTSHPTSGALGTTKIPGTMAAMQVRRLTPRECERLQYFSDDYTLIEYRGKPAADGPRYKALGNSMAVCVMRWIGRRIELVTEVSKVDA